MPSMTRYLRFAVVFFFLVPSFCFAGWQVTAPEVAVPREPFFQSGIRPGPPPPPPKAHFTAMGFRNVYAGMRRPHPVYAVSICGSLKENLERIMNRYRWRVVWKSPYDYNFDGRVTGSSLPNVVEQLLRPFPLQAVMYMSNRTVAIIPRTKTGT